MESPLWLYKINLVSGDWAVTLDEIKIKRAGMNCRLIRIFRLICTEFEFTVAYKVISFPDLNNCA